jgi:hypothetical protein
MHTFICNITFIFLKDRIFKHHFYNDHNNAMLEKQYSKLRKE